MSIVTNQIKEIHPGVFHSVLNFPKVDIVDKLLDETYGYIFVLNYVYGNYKWCPHKMGLISDQKKKWNIWTRVINFDFVITLREFKRLRKSLIAGHFIQIKEVPPDFFDPKKLQGSGFYRILEKIGWNFELLLPANDYAQIISPSSDLIKKAIIQSNV